MIDAVARFLYRLASLAGRLPWPLLRRAGDAIGWLSWRTGARESKVTAVNLALAYPELLPAQRDEWRRAVLRTTGRQALETLRLWTRPHAENLAMIRHVHGSELFDAAIASGKGVIVAAPHFGNWELLNQWLAWRTPLAILYRPPESPIGEAFLRLVRANAEEDRVAQIRAEGPGIRALFKRLRDGGVVGILPDQQPKVGDGEFAPFFDKQALTMTLVGRLAERSGATVLFAWCERIGNDLEFALHIQPASDDIASADPTTAVTALNADVERIARRDPAQYQWTYKRFKARPPGSGEINPYEYFENPRQR